ncbi:MAG: ABC-F family ATP-binding cassette domain-containing protein [Acidimicrobiia bacterium]
MPATLLARGVSRSHGTAVVLDRVDVTVGPRSRIGVVGPNGVGKSTLLRVLAGLEVPDAGSVTIAPPSATVGHLPQEPERRPGETLGAFLGRRTGVSGALAAMDAATAAMDAASMAGGDDGAVARYSDALDRWLALGGADFDARLEIACADVGLPATLVDQDLTTFSGGQAARASLAALLLSRFDVFLLDEPTNDLDFAGIARLERFLQELDGGAVVVSHDRAFLDRTITSVLELDEAAHTATEYAGGWSAYLELQATARGHAEEAFERYQGERGRLEARVRSQRQWSEAGVRRAKKAPADNDKVRAFKSAERSEKQASKIRITEKALDRLDPVTKPWEAWELHLDLGTPPRSGDVVVRLRGAVVERGAFRLGPLDLEIGWGDRVGLLGPNGSGKTTLIQALLGRVPLAAGERWFGPGVVVGELDQARTRLAAGATVLDAFTGATGLLGREARSLLAKLGLGAGHVTRAADELSPGERTRSELALLVATGANWLVLDEPTNHLDLPAIEQLEAALATWSGTLLLVTHDRRMLEAVHLTRTIDLAGPPPA